MPRTRSAGYDGQREEILAAAARLFAEQGYAGATMQQVALASGVSKPTLYHYVRDKHDLLAQITDGHVTRLEALVEEVQGRSLVPRLRLRALVERFMAAYADARHQHRVLIEDMRYLDEPERRRVVMGQRRVVAAFADTVAALRPDLAAAQLERPLTMLLFGMMNWTFTWLQEGGRLDHQRLAPLVAELFLGGLDVVTPLH